MKSNARQIASSTAAPAGAATIQHPAQLRIRAFLDAADLRRPNHAIFRELLNAFDLKRASREIAWEIWSHCNHETGKAPADVTAYRLADETGWSLKRVVYRELRLLDRKGLVFQFREHWRAPWQFECNIQTLAQRRRRERDRRRREGDPDRFGVTFRDSKLPFGVTFRDNHLEVRREGSAGPSSDDLIPIGVAAATSGGQQQQQPTPEASDPDPQGRYAGLVAAVQVLRRKLRRVPLDEAATREAFRGGDVTIQQLQDERDDLAAEWHERESRRATGGYASRGRRAP